MVFFCGEKKGGGPRIVLASTIKTGDCCKIIIFSNIEGGGEKPQEMLLIRKKGVIQFGWWDDWVKTTHKKLM